MISEKHREMLKNASVNGLAAIDAVIATIKAEDPGSFHTEKTVGDRVFFYEPRGNVRMKSYIHPLLTNHI